MEPAPRKLLAPVQPEPMVNVHPPTAEQQAPVMDWQGDAPGVQTEPEPLNTPLQPTGTVCVQEAELEQQAPRRAGHGLFVVHEVPTPLNVPKVGDGD